MHFKAFPDAARSVANIFRIGGITSIPVTYILINYMMAVGNVWSCRFRSVMDEKVLQFFAPVVNK